MSQVVLFLIDMKHITFEFSKCSEARRRGICKLGKDYYPCQSACFSIHQVSLILSSKNSDELWCCRQCQAEAPSCIARSLEYNTKYVDLFSLADKKRNLQTRLVCPVGAIIQSQDGINTKPKSCVSCLLCACSCSYKAIELSEEDSVAKLCNPLTCKDKVCLAACPSNAISIKDKSSYTPAVNPPEPKYLTEPLFLKSPPQAFSVFIQENIERATLWLALALSSTEYRPEAKVGVGIKSYGRSRESRIPVALATDNKKSIWKVCKGLKNAEQASLKLKDLSAEILNHYNDDVSCCLVIAERESKFIDRKSVGLLFLSQLATENNVNVFSADYLWALCFNAIKLKAKVRWHNVVTDKGLTHFLINEKGV